MINFMVLQRIFLKLMREGDKNPREYNILVEFILILWCSA